MIALTFSNACVERSSDIIIKPVFDIVCIYVCTYFVFELVRRMVLSGHDILKSGHDTFVIF